MIYTLLKRMICVAILATSVSAVGCGGKSDVEFPETPAEMPAQDDESAEGDQSESEG